jgi:hypothetical protein
MQGSNCTFARCTLNASFPAMATTDNYAVLYVHRLVTIGTEWYVDVEIKHIAPDFNSGDLLPVLQVKHGWPTTHIAITGVSKPPYVVGGTGVRLKTLHTEAQQDPAKWRTDLKVITGWMPGALRGDEPLTRDFN